MQGGARSQTHHRRAPQAPCGRPAFAKKQLFLLPHHPHLQCAHRLASRCRSVGSARAPRKPHLTPRPLPQAGEGAMPGPSPACGRGSDARPPLPLAGEGWGEGVRVPPRSCFPRGAESAEVRKERSHLYSLCVTLRHSAPLRCLSWRFCRTPSDETPALNAGKGVSAARAATTGPAGAARTRTSGAGASRSATRCRARSGSARHRPLAPTGTSPARPG